MTRIRFLVLSCLAVVMIGGDSTWAGELARGLCYGWHNASPGPGDGRFWTLFEEKSNQYPRPTDGACRGS